jgi:hypothetical protein
MGNEGTAVGINKHATLLLDETYTQRALDEMGERGYLGPVLVGLEDGTKRSVFFIDISRIRSELTIHLERGECAVAEPGMIVIEEVSLDNIEKAIAELWNAGFFSDLKVVP